MICGNGLWDIVANLCFSYTRVTIFLLGRFMTSLKERSENKCSFLGAPGWCLVDFGDFHAANQKNKNTKMYLPLRRQAENMRAGKLALDFWELSLGFCSVFGRGRRPKAQRKGGAWRPWREI